MSTLLVSIFQCTPLGFVFFRGNEKKVILTANQIEFFALQEVNEMWAGLGYYRRARFLLEVNTLLQSGV